MMATNLAPSLRWAIAIVASVALMAMAACADDDGKTGTDAGSTVMDAGGTDSSGSSDAGAATKDTAAASDAGTPGRNPKCTNFDDGTYGKKRAWKPFTHDKLTITCNVCRGGRKDMQGTWRLVDFDTDDPRVPLKSKDGSLYRETITVDGNHWSSRMVGKDLGKDIDAKLEGWYFCSDAAELKGEPTVFVQQKVTPEGAFGNSSNSAWGATVLHDGVNRMALSDIRYDDLAVEGAQDAVYCRVGAKVKVKVKGKDVDVLCDDPFKTK